MTIVQALEKFRNILLQVQCFNTPPH
uniref:Uncharacterized protein n=1 Tax=Moniliophthora roreri TaxID=221103 RepID=A0A0W0FSV1_MONRR